MNYIAFRGMGVEFNINPVAVNIFGREIYWYGIIIAIGFLVGLAVVLKYCKIKNINQDIVLDMILIATPLSIIGARAYYVIFNLGYYKNNLSEIFKIWHGGLAIYGAVITAIITVWIYSKYKHINILPIADIASIGFVIAQSIGRWGNFVNAEAYGTETALPWSMTIAENGVYKNVHPTFLYESIWDLMVFVVLIIYHKNFKKRNGEVFFLYLLLYSAGRFFIEFLRVDSLYIGYFRASQIVALLLSSISLFFFIKGTKRTANVE